MIVKDVKLLRDVSRRPRCEYCGRRSTGFLDPHHTVIGRGFGGGSRLDVPWNLLALCRQDHDAHHRGHQPLRCDLLAIVAQREDVLQMDLESARDLMLRLSRKDSADVWLAEIARVPANVGRLVKQALRLE